MKPLPLAPILVSLVVAASGSALLLWKGSDTSVADSRGRRTKSTTLRVTVWNLETTVSQSADHSDTPIDDIARGLELIAPDIVLLPFLHSESFAGQLVESLGAGWRWYDLPLSNRSKGIMAILVSPSLQTRTRFLIEAGAFGDALAISLQDPSRRRIHAICLNTPPNHSPATAADVNRFKTWFRGHPADTTLLGGDFKFRRNETVATSSSSVRVDEHPRTVLQNRFTEVAPTGACPSHGDAERFDALYIAADQARLTQKGIPADPHFDAFSCRPIVAEVSFD